MEKHTVNEAYAQPWVDRFGELPAIGESIYAVNPNVPADILVQEAVCLVDAMAEVASEGLQAPITPAAAWLLERNLRCVQALLGSIERRAFHMSGHVEQKAAA